MSDFENYHFEEKIVEILKKEADNNKYENFGNPYLTIYQILIIWAKNNPESYQDINKPIGGAGAGNNALSINISRELSLRINDGRIKNIEKGQLSHLELSNQVIFLGPNNEQIQPTSQSAGYAISLFRYKENK